MNDFAKKMNFIILICDFFIINVIFLFVLFVLNNNSIFFNGEMKFSTMLIYNVAFFLIKVLDKDIVVSRKIKIEKVVRDSFFIIICFYVVFYFLYKLIFKNTQITLYHHFEVLFLDLLFMIFFRIYIRYKLRKNRKQGKDKLKVVLLGNSSTLKEIYDYLNSNFGYTIIGYFASEPLDVDILGLKFLGTLNQTKTYLEKNKIDEVFSCTHSYEGEEVKSIVDFCETNFVKFFFVPSVRNFLHRKMSLIIMDGIPIMSFHEIPLNDIKNKFLKRAFDIIFSICVILFVMSWVTPILAIIIKISSRGPIFFKQKRTGLDGKIFECYKFRSMLVNDQADHLQATKKDPRRTKIGILLRKTNLDELPQFFNVLKGNMSVVGPRPHMLVHTDQYKKIIKSFMLRHYVMPGITGFAQISGYRGETKDISTMEKRVKKDIWYIENWSFLLDIKIIIMTIGNILIGDKKAF